jgi:type IV secretory pathway VirB10-like protein
MDKKQRNLLIGIAIMTLVIVGAIGIAVWVLSGDEKKATSTPYVNETPTAATVQQVGSVAITPEQIQLARGPDGKLAAIATVSALFQDFTFDTMSTQGDANLMTKSDCPTAGQVLKSGQRCQITLTYNEGQLAAAGTTPSTVTPSLKIVGKSKTPGGQEITVEATAAIGGSAPGTADAAAAAAGQAGAAGPIAGATPITSGPSAPSGIDPYGPVAATGGAQPPVDYTQPAVPAAQPTLSARDQFLLARRQAVLGNVVRRNAVTQQQVSTGDWDEIGVKKAVSSAPQDMSRVVTMDRVITAVLARTYDSRQSQQVVAQVDRNVYGAMGRNILIPRGSTIVGTMAGGADRVAVIWTQIIRPDGARFMFTGSGGDAQGQAGTPGYVNNRYFKRLGAGFLGTVIKVGTALWSKAAESPSTGTNIGGNGNGRNNGAIVSEIVSQDINAALAPIIQQAQQIQPIITVPAGTRMTILPTMDLVMRPVQRETIVRPSYPRQMNGGAPVAAYNPQDGSEDGSGDGSSIPNYPASTAPRQPQGNSVSRGLAQPAIATPGATPPWGSN